MDVHCTEAQSKAQKENKEKKKKKITDFSAGDFFSNAHIGNKGLGTCAGDRGTTGRKQWAFG